MTTSTTPVLTDSRASGPVGRRDGVFYLGRPDWLTADLFTSLLQESQARRDGAARIRAQHFAEMGPVGAALCRSAELSSFVAQHAAPAKFSGCANYRYYDIPHSHVAPHVDTDDFALNLIIMLSHHYVTQRRSGLLLFPHGPVPITLLPEPGEVVFFHAKEVIHARTPIADSNDESAVNMGIGFTPVAPVDSPGHWHPAAGWTPA